MKRIAAETAERFGEFVVAGLGTPHDLLCTTITINSKKLSTFLRWRNFMAKHRVRDGMWGSRGWGYKPKGNKKPYIPKEKSSSPRDIRERINGWKKD